MRKLIRISILALISLMLLTGCPYESPVPLSKPDRAKIDNELIGKWKMEDKESKESGILTISRFNDTELLIFVSEEGKETDAMRAFVTSIGDQKFLNVQEVKGPFKDRKWMFVNYSIEDCKLTYRLVEDSLLKDKAKGGVSQKKLYDFIMKNLANKELFDEPTTLTCVKESGGPGK